MPLTSAQRRRFDAILEDVIAHLPQPLRALLEEVPVIVDDEPDRELLADLIAAQPHEFGDLPAGQDPADVLADELCGLHTGEPLTERSVDSQSLVPEEIRLFRRGIFALIGECDQPNADEVLREEIRITLLHEMGHHFGLSEEDLTRHGYD